MQDGLILSPLLAYQTATNKDKQRLKFEPKSPCKFLELEIRKKKIESLTVVL